MPGSPPLPRASSHPRRTGGGRTPRTWALKEDNPRAGSEYEGGELGPEQRRGAPHLRLDGPERDAEAPGDLLVAQPLGPAQQEGGPAPARQLSDGALHGGIELATRAWRRYFNARFRAATSR